MGHRIADRFARTGGKLALWYGVLAPPAAWALHLGVSYSLVPYVCRTGTFWLLHLTSAVTLLIVLSAGWVSWRSWRDAGRTFDTAGGGVSGRTRFMAVSGLVLSVGFLLVILAETAPNFVLGSLCD